MFGKFRKNQKTGASDTGIKGKRSVKESSIKKSSIRTMGVTLLSALVLNMGVSAAHRTILQQGIAEEVVRFHVLANSDSEEDQRVKYLVRDEVLAWMQEELVKMRAEQNAAADAQKTQIEDYLISHLQEIEAAADKVLAEQGADYRAHAELENVYFPDRTYGDYTFPAGWYEALRIQLGRAKGRNWWCVLYPNLCFSDCLHAVAEEGKGEGEELKKVLTAEEYDSLLREPGKWKITFRWF